MKPPRFPVSLSFMLPAFRITFFASPSMTSLQRENLFSNPADVDIFYNLHRANKKYFLFYILSVLEFAGQARGVLREAWYNLNKFDLNREATMREHSVFKTLPESQIILRDFDAPVDVAEKYVQRLTSYLQVDPRFIIKTCFYKSVLKSVLNRECWCWISGNVLKF